MDPLDAKPVSGKPAQPAVLKAVALTPNPTPKDVAPAPAKMKISGSGPKKVLVIEDDPFISRMYEIKLTAAGYQVGLVTSGGEAVQATRQFKPSLMLLDLDMPEMSGYEVLSALQSSNYDFSLTQIMVLTNSSKPTDRQTATAYGAEYYVKADLTPKMVLDHIVEKLGPGELPAEAA
jgi:CheY-like chemotaxis protein